MNLQGGVEGRISSTIPKLNKLINGLFEILDFFQTISLSCLPSRHRSQIDYT
jgi:hypothetical protein